MPSKPLSASSNLPVQLTSFVGRRREIAEIPALVEANHVVSLVGAAGCGKTRLALHVAADLTRKYPEGICWVDLARLFDSTLLPRTIANALNVEEQSGYPLLDTLIKALGDKRILLVLDNCEHIQEACAQLVEALSKCAALRVLATSREPLGVIGEALYPVLPLARPAARLPIDQIRQFDAVQLFAERARSTLPTFALTDDNAEIVAAICRDLDGIPLAIELASARVSVLTVKQIQEHLSRRLDLLVSRAHADARHRSLRAAIDWSYDLLPACERLRNCGNSTRSCGFTGWKRSSSATPPSTRWS